MPWFRVDDTLATHPKVFRAGNSALGLWVRAGSWAMQQLTDGYVPTPMVSALGGSGADADALVSAGLWSRSSAGFRFHDWADCQPSRAELDAKREADRTRKAEWRRKKAIRHAVTDAGLTADETRDSALPIPSHPIPVTTPVDGSVSETSNAGASQVSSEIAEANSRPEIEHLLDLLDDAVVANGSKRPARNKRNRDAMRLLVDRDGRTVAQVEACIAWCQADGFWRSNILSAVKLREKYDELRLHAQRQRAPSIPKTFAQQKQDNTLALIQRYREEESHEQVTDGGTAGLRTLDAGR